ARLSKREERESGIENRDIRRLKSPRGRLAPRRCSNLHPRRKTPAEVGHGNLSSLQESARGSFQSRVRLARSKRPRDPDPAGRRNLFADAGESAGNQFQDRASKNGFPLRNVLRQSE